MNSSHHIPLTGVMVLVLLSILWGGNMVSIKVSNQGVPPILAAAVRSVVATFLLSLYARTQTQRLFFPWKDLGHGIAIGFLFGAEFLLLYWGTEFTNASRAIIFLYTHPLWVALGAHFLLSYEQLNRIKSIGLCLAFLGLVSVFASRSATLGPLHFVGDLMEIGAGFLWAATTLYIKRFIWDRPITHFQTLFAQLLFSIPVLAVGSFLLESNKAVNLTPLVVSAIVYQTVVVAFFSYLLWFWMIHRFQVSRLAAFTFLAPLFGVVMSGLLLKEALTFQLWIGFALVSAGIYLVNRPGPEYADG
ncbi:MAG: DMT family transporter [Desulfomonilaceae bacterium]